MLPSGRRNIQNLLGWFKMNAVEETKKLNQQLEAMLDGFKEINQRLDAITKQISDITDDVLDLVEIYKS